MIGLGPEYLLLQVQVRVLDPGRMIALEPEYLLLQVQVRVQVLKPQQAPD